MLHCFFLLRDIFPAEKLNYWGCWGDVLVDLIVVVVGFVFVVIVVVFVVFVVSVVVGVLLWL